MGHQQRSCCWVSYSIQLFNLNGRINIVGLRKTMLKNRLHVILLPPLLIHRSNRLLGTELISIRLMSSTNSKWAITMIKILKLETQSKTKIVFKPLRKLCFIKIRTILHAHQSFWLQVKIDFWIRAGNTRSAKISKWMVDSHLNYIYQVRIYLEINFQSHSSSHRHASKVLAIDTPPLTLDLDPLLILRQMVQSDSGLDIRFPSSHF